MTKKILFVAMQMSMHTVRWVNQISDQDFDVHLFPVNYLPVHPDLRGVTVHQPWFVVRPRMMLRSVLRNPRLLLGKLSSIESEFHPHKLPVHSIFPLPVVTRMLPYLNGFKRVTLGESDAMAPYVYGPTVLAKLIRDLKPDLIHSLEFQHCGYNVLRAREIIGDDFPMWLATNWGSDIYYYRQFEPHLRQISRLLNFADYYSCECTRDLELAKALGFTGTAMPVMPNTGGLDIERINELRNIHRPSKRKLIMIKGYQHFAGRALNALDAVERCADSLRDYKIVVFSASPEIFGRVDELREFLGLNIVILPHSSHEYMLRMFSRSRVYLGVSASDAISTSMLEAMALGVFPIQTNTSCCNEWINDCESGFSVPVDDVQFIAERLRTAVADDQLVDRAAELNWDTVKSRLDKDQLKMKAIDFYRQIFQNEKARVV